MERRIWLTKACSVYVVLCYFEMLPTYQLSVVFNMLSTRQQRTWPALQFFISYHSPCHVHDWIIRSHGQSLIIYVAFVTILSACQSSNSTNNNTETTEDVWTSSYWLQLTFTCFTLFYDIYNFLLFYKITLDCIRCTCQLIIKRICMYMSVCFVPTDFHCDVVS